jgi:hypothetical protein
LEAELKGCLCKLLNGRVCGVLERQRTEERRSAEWEGAGVRGFCMHSAGV